MKGFGILTIISVLTTISPNPAQTKVNISYRLQEQCIPEIRVFDRNGRMVATLLQKQQLPGSYSLEWDIGSWQPGLYFCYFRAGVHTQVRKLIRINR